ISANDSKKYPEDSFPKMKERAQEKGFSFPYLYDESQEVARAYGAERTPEVFLLGKDGRLLYHGTIDDNYEDPRAVRNHYLRDALDAALASEEPPIAEIRPIGCTIKWR
ncbi:MAG: thioredoxin family protein, partial [Rubrobacter sp.]|nr:thioredoxin family protein [Rubrobacter sp.]